MSHSPPFSSQVLPPSGPPFRSTALIRGAFTADHAQTEIRSMVFRIRNLGSPSGTGKGTIGHRPDPSINGPENSEYWTDGLNDRDSAHEAPESTPMHAGGGPMWYLIGWEGASRPPSPHTTVQTDPYTAVPDEFLPWSPQYLLSYKHPALPHDFRSLLPASRSSEEASAQDR
jgi:hypothetical protein